MSLDIRIPIGLMFGIIGLILMVFGVFSDQEIYLRSLGINVNFNWGCVLLAFGLFMLGMAWRAHRRLKRRTKTTAATRTAE
jgi:hypothetical protein